MLYFLARHTSLRVGSPLAHIMMAISFIREIDFSHAQISPPSNAEHGRDDTLRSFPPHADMADGYYAAVQCPLLYNGTVPPAQRNTTLNILLYFYIDTASFPRQRGAACRLLFFRLLFRESMMMFHFSSIIRY